MSEEKVKEELQDDSEVAVEVENGSDSPEPAAETVEQEVEPERDLE